jgi:hypothetical protein
VCNACNCLLLSSSWCLILAIFCCEWLGILFAESQSYLLKIFFNQNSVTIWIPNCHHPHGVCHSSSRLHNKIINKEKY